MYAICPKKYEYHVEYEFPESTQTTFGILVHDTIEDIHHEVIQGRLGYITNESIRLAFQSNYKGMMAIGKQALSVAQLDYALEQVLDYFNQNYDIFPDIWKCEYEISIEKPRYIMKGKIDLLLRSDDGYKIIDFKTGKRPDDLTFELSTQLYMYAYILTHNTSYKISPNRLKLYLYWTDEQDRDNAFMEVPFNETNLECVERYYDSKAKKIQNKIFTIEKIPDPEICRGCDFRSFCVAKGIIKLKL
jgi:DNA helicase II / ATP-dependent DNA helicase PcrA